MQGGHTCASAHVEMLVREALGVRQRGGHGAARQVSPGLRAEGALLSWLKSTLPSPLSA